MVWLSYKTVHDTPHARDFTVQSLAYITMMVSLHPLWRNRASANATVSPDKSDGSMYCISCQHVSPIVCLLLPQLLSVKTSTLLVNLSSLLECCCVQNQIPGLVFSMSVVVRATATVVKYRTVIVIAPTTTLPYCSSQSTKHLIGEFRTACVNTSTTAFLCPWDNCRTTTENIYLLRKKK